MAAKDWFYSKIRDILYTGSIADSIRKWSLSGGKVDLKNVDDLNIVIGKLNRAFVSGKLVVLDEEGELIEGAKIPESITKPSEFNPNYRQQFQKHNDQILRDGVSYLFFQTNSYKVLQVNCCDIEYSNKSILKMDTFIDMYESFTYKTGDSSIDILRAVKDGNATLMPLFDFGIDESNYKRIQTRGEQIADILRLDDKAIRAGQKSFDRLALLFLSPKSTDNPRQITDKTDDQLRKEREKAQGELSLDNGAVNLLNKPFEAVNTNPDNRKLDVVNHSNFAAERICNQYDYPYKLFRGDTKYDDLAAFVPMLYVGIQPRADEFMAALCEGTETKEIVRLDYSDIMEKTISTYVQAGQQSNTSSTDEGSGQEAEE